MRRFAKVFSFILQTIWKYLPYRINLPFAKAFAFLWVDVLGLRKKVIQENLKTVFPDIKPEEEKKLAKLSMTNFCRSFFDVLKIPSLSEKWVKDNVLFEGLENWHQAYSQDKGLLLLTLHMGSGDLATAIISQKILPISLITKRFSNSFADEFWFSLRRQSKTKFIDAHSQRNAFDILSVLRKKSGVIFVLDQFMGKPYGLDTKFFGRDTGTAYGLALFAKKTKAPVLPIYTYWREDQKLVIVFEAPVDLSSAHSDNDEQTLRQMTNLFNQCLERIIIKHPEHWMWVHRRWKVFE